MTHNVSQEKPTRQRAMLIVCGFIVGWCVNQYIPRQLEIAVQCQCSDVGAGEPLVTQIDLGNYNDLKAWQAENERRFSENGSIPVEQLPMQEESESDESLEVENEPTFIEDNPILIESESLDNAPKGTPSTQVEEYIETGSGELPPGFVPDLLPNHALPAVGGDYYGSLYITIGEI